MGKNNFVAITHKLCPICAKQDEGELVIHTRFGDLSEIHGKNVGFGKPCPECQEGIDKGAIMHIIVDAALSGDGSLEQLYRCGQVVGITEEAFLRINKAGTPQTEAALKNRACIIDYRLARQIGLPVKYKEDEQSTAATDS